MNTEYIEEVKSSEKKQWVEPEFRELELNGGPISLDIEDSTYKTS
jgi:hypothetical protein